VKGTLAGDYTNALSYRQHKSMFVANFADSIITPVRMRVSDHPTRHNDACTLLWGVVDYMQAL
jgi:hypothetical protein